MSEQLPTEAMCDAARAFIMGLDLNIRNFGDMRKHLERGGNPVLPYIKEMAEEGGGAHITKWDVADCIYQYMMTAAPKREFVAQLPANMNELELDTLRRIRELTKHGYKTIDIRVRKDGVETWFQGDFLSGTRVKP